VGQAQLSLFKALQSIKLQDDTATVVIAQVEDFIVRKVEDAHKGLEAELAALTNQIKARTWILGTLIVVFDFVIPIVMKLWHLG
jgi:hypothetical protein